MNVNIAEEILNDLCSFCIKKEYCKDRIMVKGINMIIKEVAPSLELSCKEHDSILTNTPKYGIGFPPMTLSCKEVNI